MCVYVSKYTNAYLSFALDLSTIRSEGWRRKGQPVHKVTEVTPPVSWPDTDPTISTAGQPQQGGANAGVYIAHLCKQSVQSM